jgi:hypothetical protein
MGFSKIQLGREEIFETTIQDESGREIANWRCMKRDYPRVVKILNNKFGLNMIIKERKEEKELDWAL